MTNSFALAILIPEDMLEAEIKKVSGYDFDARPLRIDEKLIKHIAKAFKVPESAVVIRLTHLKLI